MRGKNCLPQPFLGQNLEAPECIAPEREDISETDVPSCKISCQLVTPLPRKCNWSKKKAKNSKLYTRHGPVLRTVGNNQYSILTMYKQSFTTTLDGRHLVPAADNSTFQQLHCRLHLPSTKHCSLHQIHSVLQPLQL